jgi:hypothetical protein
MSYLAYRGIFAPLPPLAERPPPRPTSLPPLRTVFTDDLLPSSSPPPPSTPKKERAVETTRSDRIRIKTALRFGVSPQQIRDTFGFTFRQIQLARSNRLTPQKHKCGVNKPRLGSPQRRRLEQWLEASPSHRRVAYRHIPYAVPELELDCGEWAIRSAFKLLGYGRKVAKRKGLSDDPAV